MVYMMSDRNNIFLRTALFSHSSFSVLSPTFPTLAVWPLYLPTITPLSRRAFILLFNVSREYHNSNIWKQSSCPTIGACINNLWYIHIIKKLEFIKIDAIGGYHKHREVFPVYVMKQYDLT